MAGAYANSSSRAGADADIRLLAEIENYKWVRIKIVAHVTNTTDAVQQFSAIYVDGVNMLETPLKFARYDSSNIVSYNVFRVFENNPVNWAIDNFSVIKYNSENGVSPKLDSSILLSSIRKGEKLSEKQVYIQTFLMLTY